MSKYKHIIPIGTHCSTATFIRKAGLRDTSYPFDWIFSNLKMVRECINDRFANILDKSKYIDHPKEKDACGHKDYGPRTFNHNDLRKEEEYQTYINRTNKFLCDISCQEPKLFVYFGDEKTTKLDEIDKTDDLLKQKVNPPFDAFYFLRAENNDDFMVENKKHKRFIFKIDEAVNGKIIDENGINRFIEILHKHCR